MFKFITRLFTKKRINMLTDQELNTFKSQLNHIQTKLKTETSNASNKELKRVYEAFDLTIDTSLKNLEIVREVQDEIKNSPIKKIR